MIADHALEECHMTKMRRRKNFKKHLGSIGIFGIVVLMLIFVFVA